MRNCAIGKYQKNLPLLVDKQTAGKGNVAIRGNLPHEPPFQYRTLSLSPKSREQFTLSMLIALSVYDTLSTYAEGFSIKWPNDIYWKDKKICGILIENELEAERICSVALQVSA